MFRLACRSLVVVLVMVGLAQATCFSQTAKENSVNKADNWRLLTQEASGQQKSKLGNQSDQSFQEITGIRSRFGGKSLPGVSPAQAEKLFQQELKKLMENQSGLQPSGALPSSKQMPPPIGLGGRSDQSLGLRAGASFGRVRSGGQRVPSGDRLIAAKRQIARKLDQLANDLEDLEDYQMADELRAKAAAIRLKCRKHSGKKMTVPAAQPTNPGRLLNQDNGLGGLGGIIRR